MLTSSDSFSICDACLGPDKHLKMMKHPNGEECKSCTRPFMVYRWNSSLSSQKAKKTVICTTCARSKNCCQSCMLDINFHIPLHIRDTALKMAGLPAIGSGAVEASKNRERKAILADKQEQAFGSKQEEDQQELARNILTKLAERLNDAPSFKKAPKSLRPDESKLKNIDVSKILAKLPFGGLLDKETSKGTTSFFLFGVGDDVPQYLITDMCNSYGKIKLLKIIHKARCGYVSFTTREAAEAFADSINANGLNSNKSTAGLVLLDNRHPMRVAWGKPRPLGVTNDEHYKISLVVEKVMKQLAEKDREANSGPKNVAKTMFLSY
ncbi:uncharacterized protein CANTADRAFT_88354 [Suhomyces tanzawaensis NRRL Y-17324]|uniref:Pre-mRNA-splicing factor SLT11 n=1 Tax=Suhomyces tanzawaensis NRRL Y-17324 TaxID=984487 RepID=A0A1E4SSG5_9ASCO|nr:uncharacterized protein CANTADRAFT_88354 [Suhomyces tanzawaensis NRRL Y-17324]ODV82460.1 hypothetical protein CANTADRAFT_88354 [Suhomyces tanzawaensis NRRL Y-17324]